MAAASADHHTANYATTPKALFPGSLIHLKLGGKISRATIDINVVAKGGALQVDSALQHFSHCAMQSLHRPERQACRLNQGMKSRFKSTSSA